MNPLQEPEKGKQGTGHAGVDAVVDAIANAADLPLREQIAQYEAAHDTLREILASIDQA